MFNVPDLYIFRQLILENVQWQRFLNVPTILQLIQELLGIRKQQCFYCQQQKTTCLKMVDTPVGITITHEVIS